MRAPQVPKSLRASIAVGIGFFITIIGLKDGELMRFTLANYAIPAIAQQGRCAIKARFV